MQKEEYDLIINNLSRLEAGYSVYRSIKGKHPKLIDLTPEMLEEIPNSGLTTPWAIHTSGGENKAIVGIDYNKKEVCEFKDHKTINIPSMDVNIDPLLEIESKMSGIIGCISVRTGSSLIVIAGYKLPENKTSYIFYITL